ncbi:MAG: helix-turn-helix domain-containing protein [Micromonosporaceae bacterium]|nr:helix-turn-helix domain-containing protein [Micromonosporaceae bacterium]
MTVADLVLQARHDAGLSVRALADAAGVASSTVHRIERGDLQPTVDTLSRIAEAAGMRLRIEPRPDHSVSLVGLAVSMRPDIAAGDHSWPVRKAAELVRRFRSADDPLVRRRMIAAEPPATGDPRWDAFLAGLAEWLAVQADMDVPAWARDKDRYLCRGWWVTPMESMRAWEYAGSPASLQSHGVYLHRDSLLNV